MGGIDETGRHADASRDPAFLADAEKREVEVDYTSPREIAALVKRTLATPKAVVTWTREAFGIGKKKQATDGIRLA